MRLDELKDEVYAAMAENKPDQWREGQFVFNYINAKYTVARKVQFQDNIDCFYDDSQIDAFLRASLEYINN